MSDVSDLKVLPNFSAEIERLVADLGLDYIDAILHYAETNSVEEATVVDMVRAAPVIRAKLQAEGENKRMLKSSGARLPI